MRNVVKKASFMSRRRGQVVLEYVEIENGWNKRACSVVLTWLVAVGCLNVKVNSGQPSRSFHERSPQSDKLAPSNLLSSSSSIRNNMLSLFSFITQLFLFFFFSTPFIAQSWLEWREHFGLLFIFLFFQSLLFVSFEGVKSCVLKKRAGVDKVAHREIEFYVNLICLILNSSSVTYKYLTLFELEFGSS